MNIKQPLIYDSLDKPNASQQGSTAVQSKVHWIVIAIIVSVMLLVVFLLERGKYELQSIIHTGYSPFLEFVYKSIVLLEIASPFVALFLVGLVARSVIRRNSVVSALDAPISLRDIENGALATLITEQAMIALQERMKASIYSSATTLTLDQTQQNTTSTTAQQAVPVQGIEEEYVPDEIDLLALTQRLNGKG